jgi:hypothetical protein
MNPQVEAAIIAAIATLVGVGGTVLVALRGFRATKQATDATIKAQREQLDDAQRTGERNRLLLEARRARMPRPKRVVSAAPAARLARLLLRRAPA